MVRHPDRPEMVAVPVLELQDTANPSPKRYIGRKTFHVVEPQSETPESVAESQQLLDGHSYQHQLED